MPQSLVLKPSQHPKKVNLPLSEQEEKIGRSVVNAAYKVHKELGPGLLEKIYEKCLVHELRKVGYLVERQLEVPIHFDGVTFDEGLRLDILIDKMVVVEVKAVDEVNPVWLSQVLSHLRLGKFRLGYLTNFHVPLIKNGIKRIIL
jgi:GxxExxY protein